MPNFPITVKPIESSWPSFPPGLVSVGQSGKVQTRSTLQVGREWEEVYGPLHRGNPVVANFLAVLNDYWRNGTIFNCAPRPLRFLRGTGGGTPIVSGAGQTGNSLHITGATSSVSWLVPGDVFKIANINIVFDVVGNISNSSGTVDIPINPPIFAGGSPANGAALTINTAAGGEVQFRARIKRLTMPRALRNEFYEGITVEFQECP